MPLEYCKHLILVCLLVILSACATKEATYTDARDPWEGYNRSVFSFNDALDRHIQKPIAEVYLKYMPDVIRGRIRNFFRNLSDVPTATNNFLQGNIEYGIHDILRVIINSSIGVAGLFDVASKMDLDKHEEDFGQTLGVWGIDSGPYFVVPLLGSSTVRDFPAIFVDFLLNPVFHIGNSGVQKILKVGEQLEKRTNLLNKEETARTLSPDFYIALRNYYLDYRKFQVTNGGNNHVEYELDDLEE